MHFCRYSGLADRSLHSVQTDGLTMKSLGSLTPEQLAQLLVFLDQTDLNSKDFSELVRSKRLSGLLARESTFFQWGWAYELTFLEMMALSFTSIDESNAILEAAKSEDPQAHLLEFARTYDPDFSNGKPRASKLLFCLSLMMATHNSVRALKLYAKSLNQLIQRGKNGDDESFIVSVRVDPSCFDSPSLAKRMAIAQMQGDRRFLKRIYKAAADGPHSSLRVHEKLRFTAVVLEESGALKTASRDHLYSVLVEELNLYESKKGDPKKSLFRNIDLWRRASTT